MKRPTREELAAAKGTFVPDIIAPDLDVLFCGINPSLYSAAVGHHFARPGNRFWKAIHLAGFTPRLLAPEEDASLVEYGLGVTNVAHRATARADEVPDDELQAGAADLREKVGRFRPRALAILGISAYRTAFGKRKAVLGPQDEKLHDTEVWVLPNPSGLNAHYQVPDLARIYGELKKR